MSSITHVDAKSKIEAVMSLYEHGFLLAVDAENVAALKRLLKDWVETVSSFDLEIVDNTFSYLKTKLNNKALIRVTTEAAFVFAVT